MLPLVDKVSREDVHVNVFTDQTSVLLLRNNEFTNVLYGLLCELHIRLHVRARFAKNYGRQSDAILEKFIRVHGKVDRFIGPILVLQLTFHVLSQLSLCIGDGQQRNGR